MANFSLRIAGICNFYPNLQPPAGMKGDRGRPRDSRRPVPRWMADTDNVPCDRARFRGVGQSSRVEAG